MAYSGKASYSAGATLPELVDDVSDIISIVSPYETALLDHLGDPRTSAASTMHEWLEDSLLPNSDTLNQTTFTPNATNATSLTTTSTGRFQVGDQVRPDGSGEVMLVTAVSGTTLTVVRGYGNTTKAALANGQALFIVGNAALEGDAASAARFTARVRKLNYTQIFSATVDVSGSQLAVSKHGVADEMDYQKQERLRELLRDLENCVINGVASAAAPVGDSANRRTMNGLIPSIVTNKFTPGVGGFPTGGGAAQKDLTEQALNTALRKAWEQSSGGIDTIVVGGLQKRRINSFVTGARGFTANDVNFRDMVSVYESDFGVCRVILCRWVPSDTVLLLDSSRISILPLAGRSFGFRRLASAGDSEIGQVIGEYTLECRNENAHAAIVGLSVS